MAKLVELKGHRGEVRALAFAQRELWSGSVDGTARCWDLETGATRRATKRQASVEHLLVDESRLVTGGSDGTLRLFARTTGELLCTLEAHRQTVTALAPWREGRVLSSSLDGTLKLWSLASGTLLRTLGTEAPEDSETGWVHAIHFVVPGGRLAVTNGGGGAYLRLWDLESGEQRGIPGPYVQSAARIAFAREGALLVLHEPAGVALLDVEDRVPRRKFPGQRQACLVPGTTKLLALGEDGRLREFDLAGTAGEGRVLGPEGIGELLAVANPAGETIVLARSGEGALTLHRVEAGHTERLGFEGELAAWGLSPEARFVVVASKGGGLWRLDAAS